MGKNTNIEYCDDSVNFEMGCMGCELWHPDRGGTCYAATATAKYQGNTGFPERFDKPTFFHGRMEKAIRWNDLTGTDRPNKPWLNGRPRLIFLNDMGDVFTKGNEFEPILEFGWKPIMSHDGRKHTYLVTTKCAARMVEYEEWMAKTKGIRRPKHVMNIVSVTSQKRTGRLRHLWNLDPSIPVGIQFEPLLGPIDLTKAFYECERENPADWIIVGAESGDNAHAMDLDWVRAIRDIAQEYEIPFFFKQDWKEGKKIHVPELDGRQWVQMPRNLNADPVGQAELC